MRTTAPPATSDAGTPTEEYLRRIIEAQPVCLTRIAADGTFLAVNEAAMSLLGAERLDQILDTSLLSMVDAPFRDECIAFLDRVATGERGSIEVELTSLGGLRYAVQIHGVSLPGASDRLSSTFCTFRDVSEHRRLEQALLEASAHEEAHISALAAERERLNAALEETRHAAGKAASSAVDQARLMALEAALGESEERHKTLAEQHAARQSQLIADYEAAQQQAEGQATELLDRIASAEAELRASEGREHALLAERARDREAHARALATAVAEHARQTETLQTSLLALETSLMQAKAREDEMAARHRAEAAQWQQTLAEAESRYAAELQQVKQELETLQALHEGHAAERAELARAVAEAQSAHAEAESRHAAEREQLAQEFETLKALRDGHAAEQAELARALAEARSAHAEADTARLQAEQARADVEAARAEVEAAHAETVERLAVAAADRLAAEAELRGLARAARAGRLALALAGDLERALEASADHGHRALAGLRGDGVSRPHVEAQLAGVFEASSIARRIRREASVGASAHAVVGRVVQSLEPALGALLAPDIKLSVLVGSTDTEVDLTPDQLEQLVVTLVANRRASMQSGGQASLEVADVDIDEACARERGTSAGGYVLIALHVAGQGVDATLPAAIVGVPAGEDGWRAAGPGMAGVHQVAHSAGGHLWAANEGAGAIAFEVYLPRVGAPAAAPEAIR